MVSPLCTTTVVSDSRVEKVGDEIRPLLRDLAHLLVNLHVHQTLRIDLGRTVRITPVSRYWMFCRTFGPLVDVRRCSGS
jgi:hypothetical protein